MKIAIFHNFIDNIGGAEIVALTLARELKADIYTTNIDKEKIIKMGFSDVVSRVHSIGKVPLNAPFRQQITLWRFRSLKLKGYDLYIIAGDWAISGAVHNKPNLEYFHSPLNEIWEFKDFIRNNWVNPLKRPLYDVWVEYNRRLYRDYFKHVEKKVCNSENTRSRIKKYLGSDAKVVYPPVETSRFKFKKYGNFWLSVNRLFNHKRVDMQMKAFSKLRDEKLIVVGSYEQSRHFLRWVDYIKKIKPENVKILSFVSDGKLRELYSCCKGFITTAMNEDFGLTPVEAMASGKPVVACNEGGYKETVVNGETGILIDNIDSDNLVEAIKRMSKLLKENPRKYKSACLKRAREFDVKIFMKKMEEEIKK